ncbi:spore germination protein [Sediminibacillus massiliensis]|uniref:spore germination protein n=1 Tax=Sediminibacillus massiliensis TaxID=1926277 RepID=UPI000988780E|nr:spore germination protein [Sediminibacillus massiliensis]
MPCFFSGPIIINSNEGQVINGDALYVAPSSTSKVVAGAGSFNTGYVINTNNGFSRANASDPDVSDANVEVMDPIVET